MAKARRSHFRSFGGHTRLKHFVLEAYLGRWARILLKRFPQVWYVDAFAGKGRDEQGNEGSPLIACRIAAEVEREYSGRQMHVRAIELDESHAEELDLAMREQQAQHPCRARVVRGTLDQHLDALRRAVKGAPLLCFIDPFGVKGLRADVVEGVLRDQYAELLILFSATGARRLHGVVSAERPRRRASPGRPAESRSLFDSEEPAPLTAEAVGYARSEELDASQRGLETTAPASEDILNVAFGGDWWRPIIDATPPRERHLRWLALYMDLLRQKGARYVLPFSVIDEAGKHQYYLVHASTSPKALEAMKGAIHSAMNRREREIALASALVFETSVDPGQVLQQVLEHFAGRDARWTDKPLTESSVKGFAIRRTAALFSDLPQLQHALRRHVERLPGRAETFRFPRRS